MVGMRTRDVFRMPPPATTPAAAPDPNERVIERNLTRDVTAVLQACSTYIAGSHQFMKETQMKISELSTKVDELISVAKDAKAQSGSGSVGSTPVEQPDDPEVQRLADRIEDAIRVLKGDTSSGNTGAPPSPTPGEINPATGLPPPPNPVSDPNAPVV